MMMTMSNGRRRERKVGELNNNLNFKTMEINVLSFNQAIENGCEPREFSYSKNIVPKGTFKANLEFKIYAKKLVGITCYFSLELTGTQIALTVYRQKDRVYRIPGSDIDFKTCPIDELYEITIGENGKGNIKFSNARLVQINII